MSDADDLLEELQEAQHFVPKWTTLDVVYLAGFLDGEGTFTVYKRQGKRGLVYNALISGASNDSGVVLWLQDLFAGGLYAPKIAGPREQGYIWQLKDKKVLIPLLTELLPYLRIKKLQAQLLLRYCKEFRDHRRGVTVTEEDHAIRGAYCTMFAALNATGRGSAEKKAEVVQLFAEGNL